MSSLRSRKGGISIGYNIQPIVEILAKCAVLERIAKIAIGGGDETDIHFERFCRAEAFELAVLEHAKKLHLSWRRNVADFIEEERAFISRFKFPQFRRCGPRECTFLVTKKFAFKKIFGDSGAVNFYEGAGSPVRVLVNRARHQVLANAAFSSDEDSCIGRSYSFDKAEDGLHFVTPRNDIFVLVATSQRFAEGAILLPQFV